MLTSGGKRGIFISVETKTLTGRGKMEKQYIENGMKEATEKVNFYRVIFNASENGSRTWRDAAENLNFWTDKTAFFSTATK
jgi:hypothetical protein